MFPSVTCFQIWKACNATLFFVKSNLDKTICSIALPALWSLSQVHSFDGKSHSFHTAVAPNAFRSSIFSFIVIKICLSFVFGYELPTLIFFFPLSPSLQVIRFIQIYLHHTTRMRSTAHVSLSQPPSKGRVPCTLHWWEVPCVGVSEVDTGVLEKGYEGTLCGEAV